MEQIAIKNSNKQQEVPRNSKQGPQEIGDAKEAFLSVLQGLVGMINPNPILNTNLPDIKIAKLDVKEKVVDQEAQSESNNFDFKKEVKTEDGHEEAKAETSDKSSGNDVVVEAKVAEEKKVVNKEQESTADLNPEEAVKVKEEIVVAEQVVSEVEVAKDQVQVDSEVTQEQVVEASESLEVVKKVAESEVAEEAETTVNKALKVTNNDDSEDNFSYAYESYGSSQEELENSNTPKDSVKLANVKVVRDDMLRSLKDDIEVSYFEAKELMQKEFNVQLNQMDSPLKPELSFNKEGFSPKMMAELMHQSLARPQMSMESMASSNLGKSSSNVKLDQAQGIGQTNRPVLDKNTSEKLMSDKFHARTAQAQAMVDKVKEVVEQAAINKSNDSITVKVDPPHLGELTVKVSEKKGQLYAKITPESKEVEDILRSHSREISGVIQALGYKEEEVQVTIGSATSQFHNAFSEGGHSGGDLRGFFGGQNNSRFAPGLAAKEPGINIDNNLIKEDLVGWVA